MHVHVRSKTVRGPWPIYRRDPSCGLRGMLRRGSGRSNVVGAPSVDRGVGVTRFAHRRGVRAVLVDPKGERVPHPKVPADVPRRRTSAIVSRLQDPSSRGHPAQQPHVHVEMQRMESIRVAMPESSGESVGTVRFQHQQPGGGEGQPSSVLAETARPNLEPSSEHDVCRTQCLFSSAFVSGRRVRAQHRQHSLGDLQIEEPCVFYFSRV